MRQLTLGLTLVFALAVQGVAAAQLTDQPAPPDVAAPPADAMKTASGLASKVIKPGNGPKPDPTDVISVHYTGWTSGGDMFDSSRSRGDSVMFPLNKSLIGWRECVSLMSVGETRRCWIPESLAYRGAAGKPRGTVVFDVELLATYRDPNVAPDDVKEPPADAMKTASGLAYKVLRPGVGARRPSPFDQVTVHYTGWTTDGKMFDSSIARGLPTTFRLDSVIPGWTEGVGLMVEGEFTRFWIPQELAYKGEAGSPRGMLVFDVELLRIE